MTQHVSGPPGGGPGPSPLTSERLEKTTLSTGRSQDRRVTKSMWQCWGARWGLPERVGRHRQQEPKLILG